MVGPDAIIAVYMMSNRKHGTLYVGVTSRLLHRIYDHRNGLLEGFTTRHGLTRLVWFCQHDEMMAAITHEKRLKTCRREWKVNLIERDNPNWDDLYPSLIGERPSTPSTRTFEGGRR